MVNKEVDDDQLSRRCYDGLLVRLLLMKAYGFTEGKNWSIDFSQINVCDVLCMNSVCVHMYVYDMIFQLY